MNPRTVEEFEKKVVISEEGNCPESNSFKIIALLRRFLAVQQRRAQAYARLKRGFEDYMASGAESTYQQLCSDITVEFNDCSKQVSMMMHLADINPASGLFSKEGETGLEIGLLSHPYLRNNSSLVLYPDYEKSLLNCYLLIKRRPSFRIVWLIALSNGIIFAISEHLHHSRSLRWSLSFELPIASERIWLYF